MTTPRPPIPPRAIPPSAIVVSRVLAAAWGLWRRDRDLLVRIAVPFVLLPSLAIQLLLPHPVPAADAAAIDVLRAQWRFATDHGGAYLLAAVAIEYGHAALFALYVDPEARTVRDVLVRAARAWPRILLLAMVVELLTLDGLLFFVAGRLLPAGAVLLGERGTGVARALRRALRLTRGQALATSALAALLVAGRFVLLTPFAWMDAWLRALNAPNPVALAVIDAAGAGAVMAVTIAGVLVAVVLYRSLARSAADGGSASIGT